MTTDIVTKQTAIAVPAGATSTGLVLPAGLSEEEIDAVGLQLGKIGSGHQWWIGDYWNYRQQEGYGCGTEVAESLGIEYKSAEAYANVSSKYDFPIRIGNIPFGHHQAIAYEDTETRAELLQWCLDNIDDKGRPPAISKLKIERNRRLLESNDYQETQKMAGTYDVIVIDPPWDMVKIDRQVRQNQKGFDYPTMSEQEMMDMDMPAADNCHMWMWTTHKHLPSALRIVEEWGFSYICAFVWHKPGGFQPVGLPQYNCEFAIYCRKGSPAFIELTDFNVCFDAPRGDHSEKPEGFYDVVRRVTAGRRIDIFNRRSIDGFEGWGNESVA